MTERSFSLASLGFQPGPLGPAIRDSLFAMLLALGIFGPLIGFNTVQNIQAQLVLETRIPLLMAILALIGIGRLLLSLFSQWQARVVIGLGIWTLACLYWVYLGAIVTPEARQILLIMVALGLAVMTVTLIAHRYDAAIARGFQAAASSTVAKSFPTLGLVLLMAFPIIILTSLGSSGALKWIDNFGILILIYIMLGWGLNIVVGLAGLLDLGYVAFYAVGAYSYALIATQVIPATFPALGPWAFWICLPVAGLLAAFWGIILGFPVLRLRGDYLAIVTLAFGEIIRLVLINWKEFSNGYEGISTIPRPSFFGIPFNASDKGFAATFGLEFSPIYRTIFLYYVILCLCLLTAFVTIRLRRLPLGRAWEALREDEIACRALGINTVTTKLTAFAIGAMFGGFAGSFFAARQGFISPESFTFLESAVILAIVVLGGMGSQIGVAIASVVMIGGTEMLRELEWMKAIFGKGFDPTQYRMLLFGLAMVAIMIWKPRGLISSREPTAFLKERRAVSGAHVKEGHG